MNNALAFDDSAKGLSPEQGQRPNFWMTSAWNPLCAELVNLCICVWRGFAGLHSAWSCKIAHWQTQLPAALCQNVLLMICTSFWSCTLQLVCIEDWKLIGASPAWCQLCSLMVFKHITQTFKYGNATCFKWPWWAQLHFYELAVEGCKYGMLRC